MNSAERLQKVIVALEKVSPEIKSMIYSMAKSTSEMEIIHSFNQNSRNFFSTCATITKKMGKENEVKMEGYKNLFDNAIKMNNKMPIDHFTLIVLEFAEEIYSEKEDFFLKRKVVNEVKVEVGNEFSMVKSDKFKELWQILNQEDKKIIKEKMILLTTFAHVYFYQTVMKQTPNV